ncbi:MAG: hypothetical protein NVSMB66_3390 [Candidatus Doudnabacteria bacterium]
MKRPQKEDSAPRFPADVRIDTTPLNDPKVLDRVDSLSQDLRTHRLPVLSAPDDVGIRTVTAQTPEILGLIYRLAADNQLEIC